MAGIFNSLSQIDWQKYLIALVILVMGYIAAKKMSHLGEYALKKRLSAHQSAIVRKIIFYLTFLIFAISSLNEMGFKLTVLLGTAGVFTVALSFASQTAVSNLVSGLFLIIERPFRIGDEIGVGINRGVVEALDLLSTKIKTSDNRLIRIPNESLIKSDIVNFSAYSQKRDEILLYLAPTCDIAKVKNILHEKLKENSHLLDKPQAQILFTQVTEYALLELKVLYWSKSNLAMVKDELLTAIQNEFITHKIELSTKPSLI